MDDQYWEDYRKRPKNQPTDRLDRDPMPPSLEVAEAEYFADMAFDDRLLHLLEIEPASIDIAYEFETAGTQEGIASRYFTPNADRPREIEIDEDTSEYINEPIYKYSIRGTVTRNLNSLDVNLVVQPDDIFDINSVLIENHPTQQDTYHISKMGSADNFMSEAISSAELFALLLQLGGTAKKDTDALIKSWNSTVAVAPAAYHANIEAVLTQMGEQLGGITSSRRLRHEVKNPQRPEFPETIHLLRQEIETPDASRIKLTLTHATELSDLAIFDSYQLRLLFEQSTHLVTSKEADRLIKSVEPGEQAGPRLIGLEVYHQTAGKTPEKLDLDNTTVKELFVDWFDKVVSE